MRCCFTIIFNGLHHLLANNQAHFIAKNFDYWFIAEGASLNNGSTKWCQKMLDKYHKNGRSIDGTIEYLNILKKKYKNIILTNNFKFDKRLYMKNGFWESKDCQVNSCINVMKIKGIKNCFLWEIDVDEQWSFNNLEQAEKDLINFKSKTGMFLCNYYVGPNLKVIGEWGEGGKLPYRRLWKWNGEFFNSHEPPILNGGNGKETLLLQKFDHYAYCYKSDVKFKNDWYGGHEYIFNKWIKLNEEAKNKPIGFTWPISTLLEEKSYWGKTKTHIVKI